MAADHPPLPRLDPRDRAALAWIRQRASLLLVAVRRRRKKLARGTPYGPVESNMIRALMELESGAKKVLEVFEEAAWAKAGAFCHQQIIWVKSAPQLTRSWYLWQHEPCFFGWMKGKRPPRASKKYQRSVWEVAMLPTENEDMSTVWRQKGLAGADRPEHPTPKPPQLFAIPMRQHTEPGELCYEPFSGSGSQLIAGEMTGRRVYAMEREPVYVDVAVKWWQQQSGKVATLEGDGRTWEAVAAERGVSVEEVSSEVSEVT